MDGVLFFFGAQSPYSWFAAERIGVLIPEAQWRPVFAGGLFRANGRRSWGLDDRRAGGAVECEKRAVEHGLGTMRWPVGWPTSDILIARAMAFAQREGLLVQFALAAMRAAFLQGADLSELGVVQRIAQHVGLDPGELEMAIIDPSIKDSVRGVHDQAMSLGVFGVPTVIVGPDRFWGDDRLLDAAMAARARRVGA